MSVDLDDDDYGTEIDYDEDLENALQKVEANASAAGGIGNGSGDRVNGDEPASTVADIEDAPVLSPIQQFRKRGFLSVSDLVATVWCEVQYDYHLAVVRAYTSVASLIPSRLRTLPFLPPEKRPEVIKSTKGVEIKVDKVKEAKKEKVLKRGEKVHEKLEREIFPVKISIKTATPEDSWGLRLLTMISALDVLISGGKCRELPVVGFVGDVLVYGIIDEIVREPLTEDSISPKGKLKAEPPTQTEGLRQTSLDAFLSTSSPRPPPPRTHVLRVSDSKTRASGTIPKAEDSLGGRLQVMLYKELLDALLRKDAVVGQEEYPFTLLPTSQSSVLSKAFAVLGLDPAQPFSEQFNGDAAALVFSNGLRHGARETKTLADLVKVWEAYIGELGLGPLSATGDDPTDNTLALVYRRAEASARSGRRSKRVKSNPSSSSKPRRSMRRRAKSTTRSGTSPRSASVTEVEEPNLHPSASLHLMDEDTQLQLALQMSLADQTVPLPATQPSVDCDSDAELELAIKLSLQGVVQDGKAEPSTEMDTSRGVHASQAHGQATTVEPIGAGNGHAEDVESAATQAEPEADEAVAADVEKSSELDTKDQSKGQHDMAVPVTIASPDEPQGTPTSSVTPTVSFEPLHLESQTSTSETKDHPTSDELAVVSLALESQPTASSSAVIHDIAQTASHSALTPTSSVAGQRRAASPDYDTDSALEQQYDQLALAVELSQGAEVSGTPGTVQVPVSSQESKRQSQDSQLSSPEKGKGSGAGDIIGTTKFSHDKTLLAHHLHSVLGYWEGKREPQGVGPADVRRCGWCEFEENCEWRAAKAEEAWKNYQSRHNSLL